MTEVRSTGHARERSPSHPRLTLFTVIAGGLAGLFPSLVLITSLPDIAAHFDAEVDSLRWAITVPLIGSALFLPAAGKLSDTFGNRKVFASGLVMVIVGSLAVTMAWSPVTFIVFRTLTQMIGVAIQPAAVSLLNTGLSREGRARAFGWWAFVIAAGPALGLGVGGPLVDATDWKSVFYIQALLAVVALILAGFLSPTRPSALVQGPFDAAGAFLMGFTVVSTVVLIDQGIAQGFTSAVPWVAGALALAAGLLLWRTERRAVNPVLPGRLLADINFTSSLGAQFFAQATSMGIVALSPLIMRSQHGLSATEASYLLLAMPVSFAVAAPIGGRLAARREQRQLAIIGSSVMLVGGLTVVMATLTVSLSLLVIGLLAIGTGGGVARPGYSLAVAGSGGAKDVGVAVASERMVVQTGGALGVATLLSFAVAGGRGDFAVSASVSAGFTTVALLVALTFVGRQRPQRS